MSFMVFLCVSAINLRLVDKGDTGCIDPMMV